MSETSPAPTFHGRIEDGRIRLDERAKFAGLIQKLDGHEISISLKKFRRGRSSNQNGYYWAAVLPIFAEFLGYETDELHDGLKARFLRRHTDSPVMTIASTKTLDTAQFSDYVEQVRRLAAELGCVIPDPGEY